MREAYGPEGYQTGALGNSMELTFQVLEGFDKGRFFRALPSPVSIGREDGNSLRLNDERVSRFHAKVSRDRDDVILVDLDSTNGTRVNGQVVNMRCLLPGDRIQVGKTALLFGSPADIQKRLEDLQRVQEAGEPGAGMVPQDKGRNAPGGGTTLSRYLAPWGGETVPTDGPWKELDPQKVHAGGGSVFSDGNMLPVLPEKLTPAQAARLSEMLDFLHWNLSLATGKAQVSEADPSRGGTLDFSSMQRLLAVQMALARYTLALADPAIRDEASR